MKIEELIAATTKFDILFKEMTRQKRSGSFDSIFKGRGLNFDSIRHYQEGDDIRSINWNVTARLGTPHINTYTEDRQRTIWIAIDVSPSSNFGTIMRTKLDLQQEIAISLIYSALKMNDSVGIVFFSDQLEKVILPVKGMASFVKLAKVLADIICTESRGTSISFAAKVLQRQAVRGSIIVFISDFIDANYSEAFKVLALRHRLIAIRVQDNRSYSMPKLGWIKFKAMEGGQFRWVDTRTADFKKEYAQEFDQFQIYFKKVCRENQLKNAVFSTHDHVAVKLIKLMEGRYAG